MRFTPLLPDGTRVELDIEDIEIPRGRWTRTIAIKGTCVRYVAKGAPCGIGGCYCDAMLVKVVG